jgi:hypothetical protein
VVEVVAMFRVGVAVEEEYFVKGRPRIAGGSQIRALACPTLARKF